ncbi:uncharacterized protein LOC134514657 [Chroicocephalus ridibundus]|uniref:uncharacterized protein LOC134514657 n=1 Tax=Chroicocephalus ridibundus TaxID=1192867 RepID=UPI002FDE436D
MRCPGIGSLRRPSHQRRRPSPWHGRAAFGGTSFRPAPHVKRDSAATVLQLAAGSGNLQSLSSAGIDSGSSRSPETRLVPVLPKNVLMNALLRETRGTGDWLLRNGPGPLGIPFPWGRHQKVHDRVTKLTRKWPICVSPRGQGWASPPRHRGLLRVKRVHRISREWDKSGIKVSLAMPKGRTPSFFLLREHPPTSKSRREKGNTVYPRPTRPRSSRRSGRGAAVGAGAEPAGMAVAWAEFVAWIPAEKTHRLLCPVTT